MGFILREIDSTGGNLSGESNDLTYIFKGYCGCRRRKGRVKTRPAGRQVPTAIQAEEGGGLVWTVTGEEDEKEGNGHIC